MSNSQQMKKGLSVRDLITTGILAALYMVCAMIGEAIPHPPAGAGRGVPGVGSDHLCPAVDGTGNAGL